MANLAAMAGHGGGSHRTMEVVGTVMEMAHVAQYALDHRPGHRNHQHSEDSSSPKSISEEAEAEAAKLREENLRLRARLADDLALLHDLHDAPQFPKDCPPDLYARLVAAVNSPSFFRNLEAAAHQSESGESCGRLLEMESGEVPVAIGDEETSWWVLVNAADNLEEPTGIDNDSYVIISEENVVDGIAYFIARCIVENPKSKSLSPQELHRAVISALDAMKARWKWKSVWDAGKIIYTLSTWGIAFVGLYKNPTILKLAAKGFTASAKLVMKAL